MCNSATPACFLKASAARWVAEPLPDEAYCRSDVLASAIRPCTSLACTPGLTDITSGARASRLTGAKSFSGSNGTLLKRLG